MFSTNESPIVTSGEQVSPSIVAPGMIQSHSGQIDSNTTAKNHAIGLQRLLWSKEMMADGEINPRTPMYNQNTFASPSLQQFNTPMKERLVGQQELVRLIGRLKADIVSRAEMRGNMSSGLKEQDAATLDTLGWPQDRNKASEFISFAP